MNLSLEEQMKYAVEIYEAEENLGYKLFLIKRKIEEISSLEISKKAFQEKIKLLEDIISYISYLRVSEENLLLYCPDIISSEEKNIINDYIKFLDSIHSISLRSIKSTIEYYKNLYYKFKDQRDDSLFILSGEIDDSVFDIEFDD